MSKKRQPEPIVESLAIIVPAERAWDALSSPRVLGDLLMGHVEMDTRPGRPFSWHWGVWAGAAPGKGDFTWRGKVLDAVPGSTLVLGGSGMTAVFTVKGDAGASLVTVVQGSVPPRADAEGHRYGWADFLLKLKTQLERPPLADAIFLRTLVRATPAEILRTWLSPTAMGKVLPGKVKSQAKPGGRFEWVRKESKGVKDSGVFLEIVKGHRLAFTWGAGAPVSEVRVAAEATPYGALVSLEQLSPSQIAGRNLEGQRRFWSHLLERLRVYFFYGRKIRG